MIKTFLTVGFTFLLINSSHALAQSSSCFEIKPELTKLGWIHQSNQQITQEPNSYRHVEERKISIIFERGKKNDFKIDVFNIAHECHQQEGIKELKPQIAEISQIIDQISLPQLEEKLKLSSTVQEADRKVRRSLFGKKLVNDPKDSYESIMFKTAEKRLCHQKKYLEEALMKNEFKTQKRYKIKNFQVGIKEIHCGQDAVFPEDIYCDLTYVRQLDIDPKN